MEPWNFTCLVIGLSNLLGAVLKLKFKLFYSEKYFNKLETKFSNIDRKKVVKLDSIHSISLGLSFIIFGVVIKDKYFAFRAIILGSFIVTIMYYLFRKRYIVKKDFQ